MLGSNLRVQDPRSSGYALGGSGMRPVWNQQKTGVYPFFCGVEWIGEGRGFRGLSTLMI